MKSTLVALSLFAFFVVACGTSPVLITGAWINADTEQAAVVEMANFAIDELGNDYTLIDIKRATAQMVAGVNYRLRLHVERTTSAGKKRSFVCMVMVFDQPWTETRELLEYHCNTTD